MFKKQFLTRAWVAMIITLLLGGVLFVPTGAGALSKEALQRGLLSTVKILIVDDDLRVLGTCSGTHVGDGVIVTNFHCVGHTDLYGEDDTGMGLKNGDTYNSDGIVGIAPQTDPRQVPKPTYFARVASGNPDVDVAVVKIFRMIDPKAKLPASIPIPAMTLTDSEKVDINDSIYVFGYPGAGGDRITFTKGIVSGFDDQDGDGEDDSFKTDAPISPGNSGGLVTDDNGDQIGIPTYASHADIGQGLGFIRKINIAMPYVNQALDLGNATPQPNPSRTVAPSTPQPTPSGSTNFGPILFGTDFQNNKLVDQGTEFDTGTTQILAVFTYQNMRDGMKWGAVWKYNGQIAIDQRNDGKWKSGAKGTTGVSIALEEGLPDGEYELDLYINNKQVQTGTFTIGDANADPTPEPPPPDDDKGVVLKGQIVDADTEEGIPNAAILLMKPGTKLDDITQDNLEELAVAAGVTDQDGFFITAPGVPRGQAYTVIVLAQGYQARGFEDGLELPEDAPDLIELDPIPLQQQ
jgi:serine protease Do